VRARPVSNYPSFGDCLAIHREHLLNCRTLWNKRGGNLSGKHDSSSQAGQVRIIGEPCISSDGVFPLRYLSLARGTEKSGHTR